MDNPTSQSSDVMGKYLITLLPSKEPQDKHLTNINILSHKYSVSRFTFELNFSPTQQVLCRLSDL